MFLRIFHLPLQLFRFLFMSLRNLCLFLSTLLLLFHYCSSYPPPPPNRGYGIFVIVKYTVLMNSFVQYCSGIFSFHFSLMLNGRITEICMRPVTHQLIKVFPFIVDMCKTNILILFSFFIIKLTFSSYFINIFLFFCNSLSFNFSFTHILHFFN